MPPVNSRVLLLAPSQGLGGGIERYVQTLEWAFRERSVDCLRVDLGQPGPSGHLRLFAQSAAYVGTGGWPVRAVVAHRALLPVAVLLARKGCVRGISVICHGSDVWGPRMRPRWFAESRLMRRSDVRVVAVSSFTGGALFPAATATVLPPGLSRGWFDELAAASATEPMVHVGTALLTAFRLADWEDKGLPQLVQAVAALGRNDVFLTVCGSGDPPADLLAFVRGYPWCTVRAGLTDRQLACQFAAADLFVLATRTRSGRRPCGEGFGLVLLEAQIAGTPVIAPAHGGSPDAYVEGVTGIAPTNETAAALAELLEGLLKDPARLSQMGVRAAEWAQERFAPDRYGALAVQRLL